MVMSVRFTAMSPPHKNIMSEKHAPDISVVIPVFNGEASLSSVVEGLICFANETFLELEIILVNDGSCDNSWMVIQEIASAKFNVVAVNLTKNFGQHAALLAGLKLSQGKIVVTMDDDLQHPPFEISKLLAGIETGSDVVYGVPAKEQHGLWRDVCSGLGKLFLQRVLGIRRAEDTSAFRAIRREILAPFEHYENYYVDIDALLAWVTNSFSSVRVLHQPRKYGVSNYTFLKLLRHTLKMILSFTTLPLRLISIIGFIFTLFGFILLAYVLSVYVVNRSSIPGFAFLASTITILSGAQLFALGLLGEYFAKVHFQIMGRPGVVIRSVIRSKSKLL
jgi:glycosyltransferase involved in cell wall biosynthesis